MNSCPLIKVCVRDHFTLSLRICQSCVHMRCSINQTSNQNRLTSYNNTSRHNQADFTPVFDFAQFNMQGLTPLHFPSPFESSNFSACQSKPTSFHLVPLAPATLASLLFLKHISHPSAQRLLPGSTGLTLPLSSALCSLVPTPHRHCANQHPPSPASLSIDLICFSPALTHDF